MRTNGRGQGGGCMIVRRCGNYGESGYNACICKKNKEMSNVYSFE